MRWGCQALRWSVSKCFSQTLIGGDTMALSIPYARLCHAFFIYFLGLWAKLSQYLLYRFSGFFSPNGRYLRGFSQSDPVFPILQETLPWQPILWQNCGKITYPPALIAPAFRSRRVIGNHLCTVYRNLVTFSSVTAEYLLLKRQLFPQYSKNRHITQNISEYYRPTLTYFTGLVGVLVGMIFQIFVW